MPISVQFCHQSHGLLYEYGLNELPLVRVPHRQVSEIPIVVLPLLYAKKFFMFSIQMPL